MLVCDVHKKPDGPEISDLDSDLQNVIGWSSPSGKFEEIQSQDIMFTRMGRTDDLKT